MNYRALFYTQALLIALVGAVHVSALALHLYWQFPWLDTFVHFFGALWVALFFTWTSFVRGWKVSFMRTFGIVAVAGIGWELFELWGGIPREANFAFDTSIDLLMDATGGITGFFVARRLSVRDTIIVHGETESHSS